MKSISTFLSLLLTTLVGVMPIQAEMAPVFIAGAPTTNPSTQNNTLQIRLADAGNAVVEASSSLKGYSILVTDASGLPVSGAAVAIRLPEDGATGFFADGAHSAVSYTNAAGMAVFSQVNWGTTLGTAPVRVTAVKGEQHAGALIEQTVVARLPAAPASKTAPVEAASVTSLPANSIPTTIPVLVPGTPASVASVHATSPQSTPAREPIRTAETAASPEPVVSIVSTGGSHSNNKKWLLVAVVAAGAGIGAALALGSKGSSSAASTATGISIGTPAISVGH